MNVSLYSYREGRGLSCREIYEWSKKQHGKVRAFGSVIQWQDKQACEAGAAGLIEGRAECTRTGGKQVISAVRYSRGLLIYPAIMMICKVWHFQSALLNYFPKLNLNSSQFFFSWSRSDKAGWIRANKMSAILFNSKLSCYRKTLSSTPPGFLLGFAWIRGGRCHHCGPPLCRHFILWLL